MLDTTRNILVDLIISNHATKGSPAVRNTDKLELTNYLTHVLVNPATRKRHTNTLDNELQFKKSTIVPVFPVSAFNKVIADGLNGLDNSEIASLTLNNESLQTVANIIDTRTPPAWKTAIKEEGLKKVLK